MLVLTRRPGEAVVIDGGIRLEVVAIRGHHVKLGFQAPRGVAILRDELIERRERSAASSPPPATGHPTPTAAP